LPLPSLVSIIRAPFFGEGKYLKHVEGKQHEDI